MTVVTPQQYREQTNDVTHYWTEIETWLADAQARVEDYLRRQLESMERQESLVAGRVNAAGWSVRAALYPSAYPVTVVPTGYTVRYKRVVYAQASVVPWDFIVEPFGDGEVTLDLTYTGGYTEATLPVSLRMAIIDLAQAIGDPPPEPFDVHPRASSVTLGDAAVTLRAAADVAPGLDELVPGICSRLHGWRNVL